MEREIVRKILDEVREANLVKIDNPNTPEGMAKMNFNLGINNMYYSAIFRITTYKGEDRHD